MKNTKSSYFILIFVFICAFLFSCSEKDKEFPGSLVEAPITEEINANDPKSARGEIGETSANDIVVNDIIADNIIADDVISDDIDDIIENGASIPGITGEDETEPETTADEAAAVDINENKYKDYIVIPKFYNYTQAQAESLLDEKNVPHTSEFEYSAYPYSTVFRFKYYGYSDDDNYYIKPGTSASLLVSKGRYRFENVVTDKETANVVYLTFDDGPYSVGTDKVLEILAKHEIKATFFLVGLFASYYPERVRNIYDAGHIIGCHTYTHDYEKIYDKADSLLAEVDKWEALMKKILDVDLPAKLFRFAGGTKNVYLGEPVLSDILEQLYYRGYKTFDWNITNNDSIVTRRPEEQSEDEYLKEAFMKTFKAREPVGTMPKIVLMHDVKKCTADMLEWAIEYLVERGYTFDTLDHLDGGWIF